MEELAVKTNNLNLQTGEYHIDNPSVVLNSLYIKTEVNSNCYILLDNLSNIKELNIDILDGSQIKHHR